MNISATVPLGTKCGMSPGNLYPQVAVGLYVCTGWVGPQNFRIVQAACMALLSIKF